MSELGVAFVGLLGTVLVALLGLVGARRYKIGPSQEKLVSTLQDLVAAQDERINQLEKEGKQRDIRIVSLTEEVTRLTKLTLAQMVRIQELELELSAKN